MADPPQPVDDLHRSSRDLHQLRVDLERWLAGRLGEGADPRVPELHGTSANGMSSETLLFDATWNEGGTPTSGQLVARVAPDARDVPVFPTYDLERQFRVIQLVGELSAVPVPGVRWCENDPSVLGAPFFVMDRVDGEVPPDVMPYSFGDSWLFHASPDEQRRLQDSTVETLVQLHAIDRPTERFDFVEFDEPGDSHLRRHVAHARAWYEFAAAEGGLRSELVEQGFEHLAAVWPQDEGDTVLSWGDSRIGNVLYRDFRPVAVLDWEMVGLGPRELDVAWLVYAHRVFEDLAAQYGLPGMPHFLRRDDVVATYEAVSGVRLRNMDFFLEYCAVQWGIVGLRTGMRSVHFGERPMPDRAEELFHNLTSLEGILAGTYWDGLT